MHAYDWDDLFAQEKKIRSTHAVNNYTLTFSEIPHKINNKKKKLKLGTLGMKSSLQD